MTRACPRQQSERHPCVVVDGPICYTLVSSELQPICCGCDAGPMITGVPVDLEALRQQFKEYAATGRGRQFPIPTDQQIRAARRRR